MKMFHPPFLKNVSLEARLDYHKIFVNKTLTIAEQKEEIKAWAKENNLTSEVTTFFSQIDKGVAEMNQKVAKLAGSSPEAVENFTKIMKNENQTMSQMMKAIETLRMEHTSAFNVYDSAMKEEYLGFQMNAAKKLSPCQELRLRGDMQGSICLPSLVARFAMLIVPHRK
nr:Protein of unknown function DUF148 domain containing protein [Haemonchus contortus]